jgi:hypothetical protein
VQGGGCQDRRNHPHLLPKQGICTVEGVTV